MLKNILLALTLMLSMPVYSAQVSTTKDTQAHYEYLSNRDKCLMWGFFSLYNLLSIMEPYNRISQRKRAYAPLLRSPNRPRTNDGEIQANRAADTMERADIKAELDAMNVPHDFHFYFYRATFAASTALAFYYGYYWISDIIKVKKEKVVADQATLNNGAK